MTSSSAMPAQSTVDRVFGAVIDPQTWRNLLYLLISFPLGLFYFVAVVVLLSLGCSLLIVLAGLPILIVAFALIRGLVAVERALLRRLLGAVVPEPAPVRRPSGLVDRMMSYLGDAQMWKGLVYLLLHFGFAIVAFALVMSLIPASLGLLTAPLTYSFIPLNILMTPINSFDQAVFCSSAGAILGLVSLHLLNLWAALWKRVGTALLT